LVGTTANCQSLVSLSLATEAASMPVACELYLPEAWAHDRKRRLQAGVPPHLTFRTRIEMAIDQIRHAATGLPRGIVLADAAYGGARTFRDALRDLDLASALGVESNTTAVPAAGAAGHATARDRSAKIQAGAVRVDVLAGAWAAGLTHRFLA
jgi:SRSO17 transposase